MSIRLSHGRVVPDPAATRRRVATRGVVAGAYCLFALLAVMVGMDLLGQYLFGLTPVLLP